MQTPAVSGCLTCSPSMRLWHPAARSACTSLPRVLCVPLLPVGSSAPDVPDRSRSKIDRKQSPIGGHKAKERVLTTDIPSHDASDHTRLESSITRLAPAQRRLQTSLDAKRAAARAWSSTAAAGARRLDPACAPRLLGRPPRARRHGLVAALQGRRARRHHGRPRVRRLRRPAQPRGLHGARLAARTRKIMGVVQRQGRRGPRPRRSSTALEKPAGEGHQGDRRTSATRVSTVRVGLVNRARPHPDRALGRSDQLLGEHRATAATSSRTTPASCKAASGDQGQARRATRGPDAPAGADQARPGPADLAGQRPITPRRSASHARGSPAIRASTSASRPAPRSAPPTADKVVPMQSRGRRPAATATSPASSTAGVAVDVLRPPVALRGPRSARSVSQGQVIGYSPAAPAAATSDHLHFETRINGSVVNPMNYL